MNAINKITYRSGRTSYYFFILVILSTVGFFNPFDIFSPVAKKGMYYGLNAIAWIWALSHRTHISNRFPKRLFVGMMTCLLISILMVILFQKQNLTTTLITYFPTLSSWMFFPLLMLLRVEKERILKTISYVVVFSMVVYMINMAAYPHIVFGQEKDEYDMSRGMVRMGIPFIELFVLMFFYYINKWVMVGKKKNICAIIVLGTFIVLSVTRQYILLSFTIGAWIIMQKAAMKKRIMAVLMSITFVLFVLPEIPIYKTMVELTEEQALRNKYEKEDIRISAWKFYTIEYQTNALTPFFGNGIPALGKSSWGNNFYNVTYSSAGGNGCYGVDVGWAGFFWNFGGIATFCLLMMLIKSAGIRKNTQNKYLSYWIFFIIVTSIASGPILYWNQITSISTVLYLIYGSNQGKSKFNGYHHPQLQQLRGHNQLH